jgi:hypothetical protein
VYGFNFYAFANVWLSNIAVHLFNRVILFGISVGYWYPKRVETTWKHHLPFRTVFLDLETLYETIDDVSKPF